MVDKTTLEEDPRLAIDGTESVRLATTGANWRATLDEIAAYAASTVTASDVGLGSVTDDAQTKAAIIPNTAPSAGELLVGDAGGTAYQPVAMSGDATLDSAGALTLEPSGVTAATYGDSTHVPQIAVDAKGRITSVSSVAISGGGGGTLWAIPSNTYSADHTITSSDYGACAEVTTGSSTNKTITLNSAATAGDGAMIAVRKTDSGTKRCIVSDGSTDQAWLSGQRDFVVFRSNGTTWEAIAWAIAPLLDTYLSSATHTMAPLARTVSGLLVGSGAGGGSGARRASGTGTSGGAGGAGGGVTQFDDVPASLFSSTVSVTIPAGGLGGAAVTANDTNGNPGGVAGATTFGSYFAAYAGQNASNGGSTATATATSTAGLGYVLGETGTPTPVGALGSSASANSTTVQPLAGGAGAGVNATPASLNGGASGGMFGNTFGAVVVAGGVGSTKTNPGTGTGPLWIALSTSIRLGGGGGGGWFNSDGTAGDGANGAQPGGAGGGGGSSLNGNNSGKGGNGGDGAAYILTKF